MSRKPNGVFNKILNVIGIVDADRSSDAYTDEYVPDERNRPSTYVPRSQGGRRADPHALPAQGGRSSTGRRSFGGTEDDLRYAPRRTAPRPDPEPDRYRSHRSRFVEEEEPYERPERTERTERRERSDRRSNDGTIMYKVVTLRDTNPVITSLVAGSVVVITLTSDDERTNERILDTLCGAVFALRATIHKATPETYILAPKSANIRSAYDTED